MRTIIWMFLTLLFAASAVHALEISSRPSAAQAAETSGEIETHWVDDDHGDMDSPRHAR